LAVSVGADGVADGGCRRWRLAGNEIVELLCFAWPQVAGRASEQFDNFVCLRVNRSAGGRAAAAAASTLAHQLAQDGNILLSHRLVRISQ
jgi:hypothetical protein